MDVEGCAFARLTGHPHPTAMLAHDAVDGRQPQSRARPDVLRGEEGFEGPRQGGVVHAATGIGNGQLRKPAACCLGQCLRRFLINFDLVQSQPQPAVVVHRVVYPKDAPRDDEHYVDLLDEVSIFSTVLTGDEIGSLGKQPRPARLRRRLETNLLTTIISSR